MLGCLSHPLLGLSTSHLPCSLLGPSGPLQDPQGDTLLLHHLPQLPRDCSSPCALWGKREACTQGTLSLTSRISRILAPALPMSEPHWLAGMTRRSVTGALPTAAPSLPAPRSCEAGGTHGWTPMSPLSWGKHSQHRGHLARVVGLPTSSSLKAIMETARKTASVEPVMVVMRSGQDPSEMVMRALLWGQ